MRARSLKPKLFKNELLGGVDPLITILFEGLWCCADREGRLEDRPLRLCAEVFPYRRKVTEKHVDTWLTWLHEQEFIARYEVAGQRFIQVLAFHKHQKPHTKEQDSIIPPLSAGLPLPRSGRATTKVVPKHEKGSGEHALTPDSGLLTPDSSLRETRASGDGNRPKAGEGNGGGVNGHPSQQSATRVLVDETEHAEWEATAALYPPGAARADWIGAEKAARQLVEEGSATWPDLRAGVTRYAALVRATNRMVLNPVKFFTDRDKPWSQAWPIQKSETRADPERAAILERLARAGAAT